MANRLEKLYEIFGLKVIISSEYFSAHLPVVGEVGLGDCIYGNVREELKKLPLHMRLALVSRIPGSQVNNNLVS